MPSQPTETLNERISRYRLLLERIFQEGIEHPTVEFKRQMSLRKQDIDDRLEFVKLVQGVANAHLVEERLIIIGGDPKQKIWVPVTNIEDFDPAKVGQLLEKYLTPAPKFDVLNVAIGDVPIVIVALGVEQPRPITVITEGHTPKKAHFRQGDVWIKKSTALSLAAREDLDIMYGDLIKREVDEESERRARRRLAHFNELGLSAGGRTPPLSPALFVGTREQLRVFIEDAIGAGKQIGLKMLLEMARDQVIERWSTVERTSTFPALTMDEFAKQVETIYKDEFLPGIEAIVEVGLLIIKYEADPEWLDLVTALLQESFGISHSLIQAQSPYFEERTEFRYWRPAYDSHVGLRTLGVYAVKRKRFTYLQSILPQFVHVLRADGHHAVISPLAFMPFSNVGIPSMADGRNVSLWNERVRGSWAAHFGSREKFLESALQFELLLEFNSFVFEGGHRNPEVAKVKEEMGNPYFLYQPDFYTNSLQAAVPMAEYLYDVISKSPDFPSYLAVSKKAADALFRGKSPEERRLLLGECLEEIRDMQRQLAVFPPRFIPGTQWPERLRNVIEKYTKARNEQKKAATR